MWIVSTLLTTALVVGVCSGATVLEFSSDKTPDPELDAQWVDYVVDFQKSYNSPAEARHRRLLWEDSIRKVHEHNAEADRGIHLWWKRTNKFSDMTRDEWAATFTKATPEFYQDSGNDDYNETITVLPKLPKSVDWNAAGKVEPVQNQKNCGSCYAFASVGAVESAFAIKHNKLVDFSEQEVVDCSIPLGNTGCTKGGLGTSYRYIIAQKDHGINLESCYKYEAKVQKCQKNEEKKCAGAVVTDFKRVQKEADLHQAVAFVGPVAVACCLPDSFKAAGDGIYSGVCTKESPIHMMLVTGYGADKDNHQYWDVKNSHGSKFGKLGYIKISRHKNMMHIGTHGAYPIVA